MIPPLNGLRVKRVYEVYTGKSLDFEGESSVTVRNLDRTSSPADSVIAVEYNDKIQTIWAK